MVGDADPDLRVPVKIRIGISSCLLGQNVRYDGGHKRDPLLSDLWAKHVEYVPVCPELEVGMGVPRPAIHLEKRGDALRLVVRDSGEDVTDSMVSFSEDRCAALERLDLSGYIFKKDSPSCGVWRVKVHRPGGIPAHNGRGLFAEAFVRRFPSTPVEEEGRLNDLLLRENFLIRVFAHRRLVDFFRTRWTPGSLSTFHAGEKMLLMAHSPAAYAALGRRVASAKGADRSEFVQTYLADFMKALSSPASVKNHVNVLQHLAGYFKKTLPAGEKEELHGAISDYRNGAVPWLVPVTLLRHHARRAGQPWLLAQTYLDPHPKELMLRAHA